MDFGTVLLLLGTLGLAVLLLVRPFSGFLVLIATFPVVIAMPRAEVAGLNAHTVLFVIGLIAASLRARHFLPPARFLAPMLAYYGVMALSVAVTTTWLEPGRHLMTPWDLLQALKAYLWPSLVFFMAYAWATDTVKREHVLTALVCFMLVSSLSAVLGIQPDTVVHYETRLSGIAGNPNVLGIVLACFSVITLDRALGSDRARWERALYAAIHALLVGTVLFSLSRKSWIALVLVHFVWLFFSYRRAVIPGLAAASLAAVLGFGFLPETVRDRAMQTVRPGQVVYRTGIASNLDASSGVRIAFYAIGAEMLLASPAWGHGFQGFNLRSVEYGAKYGVLRGDDPHSLPLKVAVESGLIGMAVLAWVVWTVAFAAIRMRRGPPEDRRVAGLFIAACIGLVPINLVGTAMNNPVIAVAFWSFFGCVARASVQVGRPVLRAG